MMDLTKDNERSIYEVTNLQNEIDSIAQEHQASVMLREVAIYRIFKIHKHEIWKVEFSSLEQFIEYISEAYTISRPLIFRRIRSYKALLWAGMTEKEAIQRMIDYPGAVEIVQGVLEWDEGEIVNVPIPGPADVDDKKLLVDTIDKVSTMSLRDGKKYLSENVTAQPIITAYFKDDRLIVEYTSHVVNMDGKIEIDDHGVVVFYPDVDIPDWVLKKVSKMKL